MGTHPFRLLILGPTSKITGIHPFRHLYIWPYLKSQNLAPYFLAPVLRFPIGVSYPVGQKLREEIDFEETGRFGPGLYLGGWLIWACWVGLILNISSKSICLLHSYSTFPQGQRQILTKIHRQRYIQTGRQTDRQTDRQTQTYTCPSTHIMTSKLFSALFGTFYFTTFMKDT